MASCFLAGLTRNVNARLNRNLSYLTSPAAERAKDHEALVLLAENVGLAMMYTRILNALRTMKETIDDIHDIWLTPQPLERS